jgi:hypothetical protein
LIGLWCVVLMIPLLLFGLAQWRQFTIPVGELPGQEWRIWLLEDPDHRGIGFASAQANDGPNGGRYLQTNVQYWMWLGTSEPTVFCELYQREGEAWVLQSTQAQACP